MNNQFLAPVKRFLKQTFLISLLFSVTVFIFLRMIFFSFPISITEDGLIFIKTIVTGWALVMAGKGLFEGIAFGLAYGQKFFESQVRSEKETAMEMPEKVIMLMQA